MAHLVQTDEVLQPSSTSSIKKGSRFDSWRWYSIDTPREEKLLLVKLDCMILIFGCLTFFTKVIKSYMLLDGY